MVRFLASKAGTVHVADGSGGCPVVRRAIRTREWHGRKSLSPEAALDLKDCMKCETHKAARREIRLNRAATKKANAGVTTIGVGPQKRLRHDGTIQEVDLKPRRPLSGPDHPKSVRNNGGGSKRLKVAATPEPPIEDKGQRLADEHAKLAKDYGWAVDIQHVSEKEWIVVARKGDESVQAVWVNGKVDHPRVVAFFPTHTFWLKHTTQWRRQVTLPDSERPAKREPKSRPRRVPADAKVADSIDAPVEIETDGVKFNSTDLPFAKDAPDTEIIDLLRGRILHWRNNFASKIEKAEIPTVTRLIRISEHPTNGRRIVSFPEVADYTKDGVVYGCERSVAIDQMIKVRN